MKMNELFTSGKDYIMQHFGPSLAKMIIYTGVIGWFLSSAAQVLSIVKNDEISKEQKSFLIPQEIGDGAINVLAFFLITSSFKKYASKLVSTCKLSTSKIREHLKRNYTNINEVVGTTKFDITKGEKFGEIEKDYNEFKNGVDVIATTIGSILSCNIVTPLLRNNYAADQQKYSIDKLKSNNLKAPRGITIDQFTNMAMSKYGNLKI